MSTFRVRMGLLEEPLYSDVPFPDRSTYEQSHRHLALTPDDDLVEIFDQAGMSPTGRWFRIRTSTPDRHVSIDDVRETQGHDLAPVDIRDPNWKNKAQAWRAQQRAMVLHERLPASSNPGQQKPRF